MKTNAKQVCRMKSRSLRRELSRGGRDYDAKTELHTANDDRGMLLHVKGKFTAKVPLTLMRMDHQDRTDVVRAAVLRGEFVFDTSTPYLRHLI